MEPTTHHHDTARESTPENEADSTDGVCCPIGADNESDVRPEDSYTAWATFKALQRIDADIAAEFLRQTTARRGLRDLTSS